MMSRKNRAQQTDRQQREYARIKMEPKPTRPPPRPRATISAPPKEPPPKPPREPNRDVRRAQQRREQRTAHRWQAARRLAGHALASWVPRWAYEGFQAASDLYVQTGALFVPLPLCAPECDTPGCTSPGKTPHIPGWRDLADQARSGKDQGQALRALWVWHYQRSNGNVGLAVPPGIVVGDIDRKAGGIEQWRDLCDQYLGDEVPETPTAITGSGGRHNIWSLPDGVAISAGGGLEDYPGVQWKGAGGQIVVAPSRHRDGPRYEWADGFAPGEMAVEPVPDWLLKLIQAEGSSAKPAPTSQSQQTDGKVRYSRADQVAMFLRSYPSGDRTMATVRLVGVLKGKGVCQDCTASFLLDWQQTQFEPPQDPDELSNRIADQYQRYPADTSECNHGSIPFIASVQHARANLDQQAVETEKMDRPSRRRQTRSQTIIEQAEEVVKEATKRERAQRMNSRLFGDALPHFLLDDAAPDPPSIDAERPGTELDTSTSQPLVSNSVLTPAGLDFRADIVRRRLGIAGTAAPIAMARIGPLLTDEWKIQRVDDLRVLEGPESTAAQRLEDCGAWMCAACGNPACSLHGETQQSTRVQCKSRAHFCIAKDTRRIRLLDLPDLPDGESYRNWWVAIPIQTDGEYSFEDSPQIAYACNMWTRIVGNLASKSGLKGTGRVLARNLVFHLGRPVSYAIGKVTVHQESPGELDWIGEYLQERVRAHNLPSPAVIVDRSYQTGETQTLQFMCDSMTGLIGFQEGYWHDTQLFGAFWEGTRRKRLWESLGDLRGRVEEIAREDDDDGPLRCRECNRVLRWTVQLDAQGRPVSGPDPPT